jgi:hypothetical protein
LRSRSIGGFPPSSVTTAANQLPYFIRVYLIAEDLKTVRFAAAATDN